MIIGAGRCNDIDLRRLVASAENVLLLDVDMEAMHEAVMALPEDIRHKVESRVASVTGINEDDLSSFCEDMLSFVRSQGRELKMESIHRHLMIGLDSLADKLVPKGSIKVHGDDPVVHKIISYSICKIDLIYF